MTELRVDADEALRLAGVDPAAAVLLAGDVVPAARATRSWGALCVAERALGVAAMQQSRLDDAVGRLRAAVRAGRRASDARLTGEARMSLASALMLRGRPRQSAQEISRALAELDGVAAARALTQRAAISQELGHLDDAFDDLRRALPVLRRAGDVQWATRALSNRGLLHTARREFVAAESDLVAAGRLCAEHGLRLPGAIVSHNLAWVHSQRGDVPAALRQLTAAEDAFRELDLASGSILTDRAELLLSVRLVDEARATAEAAVAADERDGRGNHLPEAQLLLSTIALVQGDVDRALAAAGTAMRGFGRMGRTEWATLARYARIQALAEGRRPVTPAQARRSADALAQSGWAVPALEARILAARLALRRGEAVEARRDLTEASRARRSGPADARARAWLAEAMLREQSGERPAAVAALRAGLRVVEEHRATLGATELRAHVTVHRGRIARMGLRLALEDRSARHALWWAECNRATATLLRRAHPPEDPVLADLLARLRATMTSIEERRTAGLGTAAAVQQQVTLERTIRDHCRQLPGCDDGAGVRPRPVADLQAALGDAVLVEYVEHAEQLLAVTVTASHVRLHPLGAVDDVRAQVELAGFALRRLAAGTARPASLAAASAVLTRAGARFDELLLAPLRAAVGDRPLVVVPVGALQSVPWSLLASCRGRAVSVSPSASLWHAAARREPPVGGGVVVVAGPGLPGAHAEAGAVAAEYPGAEVLVGADAAAAAVARAIDGAALVHLAAHGWVRSDNPMFSSLTLADGPFTVYDLERVPRAPHHVVLAACDTAQSAVVAGGEILGFTAALLAGGTATLVAPVVPVPDAQTVALMVAYHRELGRGCGPAEALAHAQAVLGDADASSRAAAAGFVVLGSGDRAGVEAGALARDRTAALAVPS
ncbi:CHAT domain-containing protein [Cellulomonas cellasea]|uniref:Tetratricopeptide (TPR) repeat protein n=1 Tax=Cellulomonas cellasea TaxID=43670 RepID=A0A7W4UCK1_9CELL|nr:CHAT domain-containing protein [Cellulomonas cellasea]MBB2921587.1 tetratricopeptide (TPR) repeat protein [Cellulomonas cellasea]